MRIIGNKYAHSGIDHIHTLLKATAPSLKQRLRTKLSKSLPKNLDGGKNKIRRVSRNDLDLMIKSFSYVASSLDRERFIQKLLHAARCESAILFQSSS
jgi:hypothetical protein